MMAVSKMTGKGNKVILQGKDPRILNERSGQKTAIRKEGNVYVMSAVVHDGEMKNKCKVIVDFGAAVNVMPHGRIPDVQRLEGKKGVRLFPGR